MTLLLLYGYGPLEEGGGGKPKYKPTEYEKQLLTLPEREQKPDYTYELRMRQNAVIEAQAAIERETQLFERDATRSVDAELAAEADEFNIKADKRERALINLGKAKLEPIETPVVEIKSRNLYQMRKEIRAKSAEVKEKASRNAEFERQNTEAAKRRVAAEKEFNKQHIESKRQPLIALKHAEQARAKEAARQKAINDTRLKNLKKARKAKAKKAKKKK